MIYGVDGSGPIDGQTYGREMANSFVHRLCKLFGQAFYQRGPDPLGRSPASSLTQPKYLAAKIRNDHTLSPNELLYLAGYSRGGAVVLDAAVYLKDFGIQFEAIWLFDPVDRAIALSGEIIPSNVKHCYHAIRDPVTHSRDSFGYSVVRYAAGVDYQRLKFKTTHAGLGGVPYGEKGLVKPAQQSPYIVYDQGVATDWATAEGMVRDNPAMYADKIYEGIPDWRFTNVTVAQEQAGMMDVERWMFGKVPVGGTTS